MAEMTKAQKIVSGEIKVPKEVAEGLERDAANAQRMADGITEALDGPELRDRVHLDTVRSKLTGVLGERAAGETPDDEGLKLIEAYETGGLTQAAMRKHSGLKNDEATAKAREVAEDWLDGSTYSYSFYPQDDGSVVVTYCVRAGEKAKLKAFGSTGETRGWHPVRNPLD